MFALEAWVKVALPSALADTYKLALAVAPFAVIGMNKITLLILLFLSIIKAEVKINAQDGSEDDRYGQSVALGSESLFVGANRDFNNGINSGSVYVYSYNENMSISFSQKLIPSDYSNDQYFGKVVDVL